MVFLLDIGLIDVLLSINFWYKHTTVKQARQLEQYPILLGKKHLVYSKLTKAIIRRITSLNKEYEKLIKITRG